MDVFWVAAAFVAGQVARLVKLPTLVGYLLTGLVLAVMGFESTDTLKVLGDFGVTLLLFTVGLHIRVQNLVRPEVLGVGGLHLLISTGWFTGVGILMGIPVSGALLLAVALGFSSTVLTARSLEARSELDAYHGRIAIGILILQDVVAVGLLAVTGAETPTLWSLALLGLVLARPVLIWLLEQSAHEEIMLLYGLLIALGIGWLFGLTGLSAKLGALVGGMLLAGHNRADDLYDQLWALKEVFLVGFFLDVGLAGLPDAQGLLTVALLLALLPLKSVLFFALLMVFRLRARTAFMASTALTAYSEFALIVGVAAVAGGLLDPSSAVMLALLVAASYALNAPLNSAAEPIYDLLDSFLTRFERADIEHPDDQPETLGHAHFLIVGMGDAGQAAYDFFKAQGERPVGLDSDPGKLAYNLKQGRRVLYGDAKDPGLWEDIDLHEIEGVVIAISTREAVVSAAQYLKENGYSGSITAMLRETGDEPHFSAVGVKTVALPVVQAGRDLAEMSLSMRSRFMDATG